MNYTMDAQGFKTIREIPEGERPREKIQSTGVSALSDSELMCCILGSGNKEKDVASLSREVLDFISRHEGASFNELMTIKGLGNAKASVVASCLELGRRLSGSTARRMSQPVDIYNLIRHYGDRQQEHFITILLNGALEIMSVNVVTVGLVNKTLVHPREVFSLAIKERATSLICAHNHPSSFVEPSDADIELTRLLAKSGEILGIKILDHIVFNSRTYVSFAEKGIEIYKE